MALTYLCLLRPRDFIAEAFVQTEQVLGGVCAGSNGSLSVGLCSQVGALSQWGGQGSEAPLLTF
jgi:hypothetical protein